MAEIGEPVRRRILTERTAYCDCGAWSGSHCRPAHCGKSMTERTAYKLRDERTLEIAEETLTTWAGQLADDGRDVDAAEALRVSNVICKFRCGFLESEKSP